MRLTPPRQVGVARHYPTVVDSNTIPPNHLFKGGVGGVPPAVQRIAIIGHGRLLTERAREVLGADRGTACPGVDLYAGSLGIVLPARAMDHHGPDDLGNLSVIVPSRVGQVGELRTYDLVNHLGIQKVGVIEENQKVEAWESTFLILDRPDPGNSAARYKRRGILNIYTIITLGSGRSSCQPDKSSARQVSVA
jgi:hypothetical protein